MRIYAGLMFTGAAFFHAPESPATTGLKLLVGLALLSGAVTRAAALVGLAVPIHSLGILVSPGPRPATMMLLVTVMLGAGGRVWGVDTRLARRYPGIPLW
jgi:hypothetical protein